MEQIASVDIIDDFRAREDGSIFFTTHGEEPKSLSTDSDVERVIQSTHFVMINDGGF